MGNFNWLHLSDLHFEQFEGFDVTRMRTKLLEELKKLDNIKYVFITGDIANKFQYGNAKELIDEIKRNTGVKEENVFWSVGNHDISRENENRNNIIKRMRNKSRIKTKKNFEDIIKIQENRILLYDFEFEEYYKKHSEILGYVPSDKPHAIYEREDVCIININTCIASYDDNDAHQLRIIEPGLLKIFEKKYNKPVFVLGHHTIDFFCDEEKEKIQELFDGKVDLYLCGHAHRLGYMTIPNTEMEIHEITCGGGVCDNYSVYSFVYGKYNSNKKSIKIIPYSYRDRGNKKWELDYELHRKLTKDAVFYFNRLLSETERKVNLSKLETMGEYEDNNKKILLQLDEAIETYHLDKRVKKFATEQGIDKTCQIYTKYFADSCQIPESIKYIKDTCMFKELVEIIVNTNSKFPLYISGEIGTGKSSFLTLLYMSLKKWGKDVLPLYFDLHSFESQEKQIAIERFNKETMLYESIISAEKDKCIILIIDGIDDHNRLIGDLGINWVNKQISTLGDVQNKKIVSLGFWGEGYKAGKLLKFDDIEPTYTIILNRLNIFVKNDHVESFVRTQVYDENDIKDQVEKIKNCIETWNLEKVDFRLLCMILDSQKAMLKKTNTYTSFLNKYCLNVLNYKESELERVSKEAFVYNETGFSKENVHWEKSNSIIFRHREICSFLIAYYYYSVLVGRNIEERNQLLRKKFVFSKESNGHIKNLILNDRDEQVKIYQIMKEALSYESITFDMRAQICYLLPRVFKEVDAEDIMNILQIELRNVSKKIEDVDHNMYNNYDYIDKDKELILLLRTIVCSLAICGNFDFLYKFVGKILVDKRYRNLNRQFYCDYYSNVSKEISLENISLLEIQRENIKTTLLQLRHQIMRATDTQSFKNYNLFVLDVVTYFTIIQDCIDGKKRILTKKQEEMAKKVLRAILSDDETLKRLKKAQDLYDYLHLLDLNINNTSSVGILENLYSLKTKKRAGWKERGIENGESIADHIYGAYLLGLFYLPDDKPDFLDIDYSDYDKEKVLNMILLHDIGEAYTGDIISTKKTDEQKFEEHQIAKAIFMSGTYLKTANLEHYKIIWEEFVKNNSINAKLAHELDKIENLVQLLVYRKSGIEINDFGEWEKYLRSRMTTSLGKSIYEFIDNSFK